MLRCRQIRALAIAALTLLPACRSDEPVRLAPILRIGEERGEITASIGDETRYLLAEIPHGAILLNHQQAVPADGVVSIRRKVGSAVAAGGRVVVSARASVDSRSWTELPRLVAPILRENGEAWIDFALELPESMRGSDAILNGTAFAARANGQNAERSDPIAIPRGAVLEVGGGILAVGRGQGDVRFRVEACRPSGCVEILDKTVGSDSNGWADWTVSLGDFAGEEVQFAFATELVAAAPNAYSLAVWSRPILFGPAASRPRPNVVLLSIDTLRADHLTSYGHERDTAPKMRDWFERGGVLFENAVAASTTTGPAHMTMFTSLAPSVHGITNRPGVHRPPPLTLAEVLRANGYVTGAVTEDGPLHAGWGFSRGFDSYAENKSADVMLPEGHVAATFAAAESWLRRNSNRPFFLFLHTFEVHYPYTPPARYAALFGDPARDPGLPPDYAPVLYDREIRHVDDQLDTFLGKLKAAGVLDDTIFIVTADHGDEFLEHGHIGHAGHLHPEVLHVPLMLRGPGIPAGRRITTPVGHADYKPTVLGLLGIESPAVMMGRDLAALVRGEIDSVEDAPLFSEAWYGTAMLAGGKTISLDPPSISVRTGSRKLIRNNAPGGSFAYSYYDLTTDPGEQTDLYAERSDAVADLRELLAGYEPTMAGLQRRAAAARAAFARAPQPTKQEVEIDPAVAEKLRALGYVE